MKPSGVKRIIGRSPAFCAERLGWLVRGKKVCGILIEQTGTGSEIVTVAGIGLNLNQTADEISARTEHVVVERAEHAAAGFQLVREAGAGRCGFLVTEAVEALMYLGCDIQAA